MEIRQIRALLAVIKEGNFSRAAERLNLTQPSLSARIQQLEKNLGEELFRRDKRPIVMTAAGELFADYAERAITILDAGAEAVRSTHLGVSGRVSICCPFSLATYLMPQVVNHFSHTYPSIELYLQTGHSDYAVSQLLDGLVNLAFAATFPRLLTKTQTLLRFHDEMIVAVSQQHELAGSGPIPVSKLWQYQPLIIHWGDAFDAYVDSLRQMHDASGSTIRVPLAAALPMTRQPNTITFLPRRLAHASGLVVLELPEFRFDWDVALMSRPGHLLSNPEQAFVDTVSAVWYTDQVITAQSDYD
jgi:DNA-binding transcriptional LysR family regulator